MKLPFIFILLLLPILCQSVYRTQRGVSNGCERLRRIDGATETELPPKYRNHFERPWLNRQFAPMFYNSTEFTYNWFWFKELKIQGFDDTLVKLMQLLDSRDCFFMPYGDGVRNILIGTIKDVSMLKIAGETTCDAYKLYDICKTHYGRENCGTVPRSTKDKVTFGNSRVLKSNDEPIIGPITLSQWNTTYSSDRLEWDFTANMGAIFDDLAGPVYFIDLTAESQHDICYRNVKAPLQPSYWEAWTQNSIIKVLDAYNLIVDGFVVNSHFHHFLIQSIKSLFNSTSFQEWYCRNVFGGIFYPSVSYNKITQTKRQTPLASQCQYLTPDARRQRLIRNMNQTLHEDFKQFWDDSMVPSLAGMRLLQETGQIQRVHERKIETVVREYTFTPAENSKIHYPPRPTYPTLTTSTTTAPIWTHYRTNIRATTEAPVMRGIDRTENVVPATTPQLFAWRDVISHQVPQSHKMRKEFKLSELPLTVAEEDPWVPPNPTSSPEPVKQVRMSVEVFTVGKPVVSKPKNFKKHELPYTIAEDYSST